MNAPNNAAASPATGAPTATAPPALAVAEGDEPLPLRLAAAVVPLPDPDPDPDPDPELALPVADAVGAAAKTWLDENVWQLLEDGMDVVYGGTTGPVWGWNQVVVWPGAVVNTPGGVMSSLSQTS
jgi:hypothetical protein